MKANRKADLQRKLALTPAPRPPSGLAERIKRDIPNHLRLDLEGERRRAMQSWRLSMAVAASVLVVAVSAFVMLRVSSGPDEPILPPAASTSAPVWQPPPAPQVKTELPPAEKVRAQADEAARPERRRNVSVSPRPAPAANIAAREEQRPADTAGASAEGVTTQAKRAAPSAAGMAVAEAVLAPRIDAEATIPPEGGKVLVRITPVAMADARIEVEGARKLSEGLYELEGPRMRVRVNYRMGGEERTLERSIVRAEARPWDATSRATKDAVRKAQTPPR